MTQRFDHGYALLIGVGQSAYPKWSLPVTVKDMQALRTILTDPNLCAYHDDDAHIRLLHDAGATRQAILDGLAWLAHSLGLGAGFGNILLIGLLVLAAMAVIGMLRRGRQGGAGPRPMAYQGAGAADPVSPPQYNPTKVGNDASARPWDVQGAALGGGAAGGSMIGSALKGSQGWGIPADFDVAGFTEAAKRNFMALQQAWDHSDIPTLRAMMTDEMLAEIQSQLAERERTAPGQANTTEVAMLEAQLLGIEEQGDVYMASVEFSGMIREDASSGLNPFREVWNMTKPRSGRGGWLVAGVQALQ